MNVLGPTPTQQIFQRTTHVVEPTLIEEVEVSVRQRGVNQGGSGVDQVPKIGRLTRRFLGKRARWSPVWDSRRAHLSLTAPHLIAPILIDDATDRTGDAKADERDQSRPYSVPIGCPCGRRLAPDLYDPNVTWRIRRVFPERSHDSLLRTNKCCAVYGNPRRIKDRSSMC